MTWMRRKKFLCIPIETFTRPRFVPRSLRISVDKERFGRAKRFANSNGRILTCREHGNHAVYRQKLFLLDIGVWLDNHNPRRHYLRGAIASMRVGGEMICFEDQHKLSRFWHSAPRPERSSDHS